MNMTSESTSNILEQYRAINNKLKKRFLRKPNEAEAAESFAALGRQCEAQELPQYAALSWISAAKCEGSLGNNVSETSYLLKAARHFRDVEQQDAKIGCTSAPTENLEASLACYNHASSRYPEDSATPLGLNLEIADFLQVSGHGECSKQYLEKAVELSKEGSDTHIHTLDLLASHSISTGDYVSALNTYREITKLLEEVPINGYRCDILLKCEVNSVFLLLILRPSPKNISPDLAKILERYTWGDQNDVSLQACRMSQKMFLHMQSLVITCQSLDTSCLPNIECELWTLLSVEQKDLLRILVRTYYP